MLIGMDIISAGEFSVKMLTLILSGHSVIHSVKARGETHTSA